MIAKLFWLFIIALVVYGGAIFIAPDIADTYGNKEFNTVIRLWKLRLESTGSGWVSSKSLIESARDIAKPYIDESQKAVKEVQNTAEEIKTTIDTKTEQVSKAIDSTQKAINSVNKAKEDIGNTLRFSSWSR